MTSEVFNGIGGRVEFLSELESSVLQSLEELQALLGVLAVDEHILESTQLSQHILVPNSSGQLIKPVSVGLLLTGYIGGLELSLSVTLDLSGKTTFGSSLGRDSIQHSAESGRLSLHTSEGNTKVVPNLVPIRYHGESPENSD